MRRQEYSCRRFPLSVFVTDRIDIAHTVPVGRIQDLIAGPGERRMAVRPLICPARPVITEGLDRLVLFVMNVYQHEMIRLVAY